MQLFLIKKKFFYLFFILSVLIFFIIKIIFKKEDKILVIYAYYEKNPVYIETFQFFLDFGVKESNEIQYIFVVQGFKSSVKIPNYHNVKVIRRKNDCYDFGAYGYIFKKFGGKKFISLFETIIFLNPSAVGPILPKYWPENIHWTEIFRSRLKEDIHAVSTSIVCLPKDDLGGQGPRLEGMALAATRIAVLLAYENSVFSCKLDKSDAILSGEYNFSKVLLDNGYNIDSLLMKYGKIDWRKKEYWSCNNRMHPTRYKFYENISVNPLEVVFHKPLWDIGNNNYLHDIYFNETIKYLKWARLRTKN